MISEAIGWVDRPGDRIDLVIGFNDTDVNLEWTWKLEGATFRSVKFEREKPGENKAATQIASRGDNFGFNVLDQFVSEYAASDPATLILKNVDNMEEYIYTVRLSYKSTTNQFFDLVDRVSVVVNGKKRIFLFLSFNLFALPSYIHHYAEWVV